MPQKIRSDAVTSFSVLGLVIILSLGGLIILLSYTIEFVVGWIQTWKKIGTYQRLEWIINDTLQLQRLAHEELGFGSWTKGAAECPITAPGDRLAVVDVSEPTHPRLQGLAPECKPSPGRRNCSHKSMADRRTLTTTQIPRVYTRL